MRAEGLRRLQDEPADAAADEPITAIEVTSVSSVTSGGLVAALVERSLRTCNAADGLCICEAAIWGCAEAHCLIALSAVDNQVHTVHDMT